MIKLVKDKDEYILVKEVESIVQRMVINGVVHEKKEPRNIIFEISNIDELKELSKTILSTIGETNGNITDSSK
jgi:CTP:phosphocholine cytidylyltransferase-like protein